MKKHGLSGTKLYSVWLTMKQRCQNSNCRGFKWYGAKGVKICQEWEHDAGAFCDWAKNNGYKEGLTIDRIDPAGDYTPENCRWISMQKQQRNKSTCHYLTYNGQTLSLQEWSEKLGIKPSTLRSRLNKCGWSAEKAFTKPIRGNHYEIHSL